MKIRFFVMLILIIGLIWANIFASGGTVFNFVNAPTIIFLIAGSFILMIFSYSPKEIISQFKIVFNMDGSLDELKVAEVFFSMLRKFVYLLSFIGFAIGIIAMLVNIDISSKMGLGFSLSFLSIFIGMIFDLLIVLPCLSSIKKQIATLD